MAIDLNTEQAITLTEASRLTPPLNGRKPSLPTLWRWCRKGVRGTRLEYVRIGRNIATSREALHRFFAALAAVDVSKDEAAREAPLESIGATFSGKRSARDRERAVARADALLAAEGM